MPPANTNKLNPNEREIVRLYKRHTGPEVAELMGCSVTWVNKVVAKARRIGMAVPFKNDNTGKARHLPPGETPARTEAERARRRRAEWERKGKCLTCGGKRARKRRYCQDCLDAAAARVTASREAS